MTPHRDARSGDRRQPGQLRDRRFSVAAWAPQMLLDADVGARATEGPKTKLLPVRTPEQADADEGPSDGRRPYR